MKYTPNINLAITDMDSDGDEFFDFEKDLNENFVKIDNTIYANRGYNVFCANTGLVENAQPAFLKLENNILKTNGTFDVTTANGKVYTLKDIVLTLDLSSYESGEYNIFVNPINKCIKAIKNTIHIGNFFPSDAEVGDYLLNIAKLPYSLEEKTHNGINKNLNDVFVGTITI